MRHLLSVSGVEEHQVLLIESESPMVVDQPENGQLEVLVGDKTFTLFLGRVCLEKENTTWFAQVVQSKSE